MNHKELHISPNYKNQLGTYLDSNNNKISLKQPQKINEKNIYFYNFPLPAIDTCIHAPEACKKICTGARTEHTYGNESENAKKELANRLDNYHLSKDSSFSVNMIKYIKNLQKKWVNDYEVYFRIDSTGDLYEYDYLVKWCIIAHNFSDDEHIHFMLYTKEIDLLEKIAQNKDVNYNFDKINIKFIYSIMKDFDNGNTSSECIKQYNNLVNNLSNNTKYNMISSYIVHQKNSINFQPNLQWCMLSPNLPININKSSKIITDPEKNEAPAMCIRCMKCYHQTSKALEINMIELNTKSYGSKSI